MSSHDVDRSLIVMAGALVQSTNLPSAVAGGYGQIKGFRKSGKSRAVKMLCPQNVAPLRIRSFSGLRGSTALDNMVKSGQSLHLKVANATSGRRKASRMAPRAMFERFTEKAIKVIMLAQEEARRLGHNFVGTEQILLGLIGEGTGIAAKVLKSMGINLKDARVEVEKIIGRGSGFVAVEIPFTPRAKRVLELSLEEARQLGRFSSLWYRSLNFIIWFSHLVSLMLDLLIRSWCRTLFIIICALSVALPLLFSLSVQIDMSFLPRTIVFLLLDSVRYLSICSNLVLP